MNKPCPECGSDEQYRTANVCANGGQGPRLLPGLGTFFSHPTMTVIVCRNCGFIRFYASPKARGRLAESSTWQKLDAGEEDHTTSDRQK